MQHASSGRPLATLWHVVVPGALAAILQQALASLGWQLACGTPRPNVWHCLSLGGLAATLRHVAAPHRLAARGRDQDLPME